MVTLSEQQQAVYRRSFRQRLAQQHSTREEARRYALAAAQAIIPQIAAAIPSVQKVYLFGSIIQPGRFHQQSDIDVAVVGSTAADYFVFWRELETALPDWVIDLRDITDESPFASRVKRTGVLFYERTNPSTTS